MRPPVLATMLLTGLAALGPIASAEAFDVDMRTDLPRGDFVTFKGDHFALSFTPSHDGYATILALDKKGNVRVVFPNRWQQDNFVRAGDEVTVEPIYADYTGPLYAEAILVASDYYAYAYGDRQNPFWNEPRWGTFDASHSFLSDRRGTFTVSFDDAVSRRPPSLAASYDAERLEQELTERIDADYATFEQAVRDFRDEVYEVVGGETWASGYVDVYVAERRFDPSAYDGDGTTTPYEAPSYASYYEYEPTTFDYEVALSGYGSWIDVRGIRVWRPPAFGMAWRPFYHGYWTYTSHGWYWVGYEPFAWVTYHYGYWHYDPFYGWYWIPDYWSYRWVPANCGWYRNADYVCWYPTPPPAAVAAKLHVTVSLHADLTHAVVVHARSFLSDDISKVAESPKRVTAALGHVKARFDVDAEPRPDVIGKATGRRVVPETLRTVEKVTAKGKKVDIVKPPAMKPVPKVFRDLDAKARKEVLSQPPVRTAPSGRTPPAAGQPKPKTPRAPAVEPPAAVRERPRRDPAAAPTPASRAPRREPGDEAATPQPKPSPSVRTPRNPSPSPRATPAREERKPPTRRTVKPRPDPAPAPAATAPPAPKPSKPEPKPPKADPPDEDEKPKAPEPEAPKVKKGK